MRSFFVFAMAAVWLCGLAQGETYLVRPDGTGDYATIQEAVNHAQDGDVIELADGTYVGDGNRDVDYLGKGIAIRSVSGSPETCVIDCGGVVHHRGFVLADVGPEAELEGITVCNGYEAVGGAVLCSGVSSPRIRNCSFVGNTGIFSGGAIYVDVDSHILLSGCIFWGNRNGDTGGDGSALCM